MFHVELQYMSHSLQSHLHGSDCSTWCNRITPYLIDNVWCKIFFVYYCCVDRFTENVFCVAIGFENVFLSVVKAIQTIYEKNISSMKLRLQLSSATVGHVSSYFNVFNSLRWITHCVRLVYTMQHCCIHSKSQELCIRFGISRANVLVLPSHTITVPPS